MTHLDTIDAFVDHTSGRLSESERSAVDQHLSACASCRSTYALLSRTILPQPPARRLTADPFLPTRIRAIAGQRATVRPFVPMLRWSFASVAFGAAIALGILLGRDLSSAQSVGSPNSQDLVTEFASSLRPSDLSDQWTSAFESEGAVQP